MVVAKNTEKNNEEAAMSKPTKRRATPTAKTPKRLEDHKQTKPPQLSLFEMLAPEDRRYSNTIELYDFIPKYNYGKVERIGGEFLRALEREFECRGLKYTVKIHPASIEDEDGVDRYYYPSKREE